LKLSNSKGFSTGAIYGFYLAIKKLIAKYGPEYLGICFDVSRKTFRQDKFKDYKIHRPPAPDDLIRQIPLIKNMTRKMGLALVEKEGFEADDVIATLTKKSLTDGCKVVLVTSDKDMLQLMEDERVSVFNPANEKTITKFDFMAEYGFSPASMADFLALTGDSVDNVPGAKGIGKVGASNLIKKFATVEKIFENLDQVSPKIKQALVDSKEDVVLSKELVLLHEEACDIGWKELKIGKQDDEAIRRIFEEMEFKSALKEIPAPKFDLKIDIKEGLPAAGLKELAFFCQADEFYFYDNVSNCIYKSPRKEGERFLEIPEALMAFCGYKDQADFLPSQAGAKLFDIERAAYLIDSGIGDYGLSNLTAVYLKEFLSEIPVYAAPYFIFKLYLLFEKRLRDEGLQDLFSQVEMPLEPVLFEMSRNGVKIDISALESLLLDVDKRLALADAKILEIAGHEFNLNSPSQVAKVLFDELKLPALKKTKTGYSTNEEVLEKLSDKYPVAALLLEYRYLHKLKTTYIGPLLEQVKNEGGILHARFNQTVTATGRLSSSSPNLQSIPVKGELSAALRRSFVPSFKNGMILSADYSQVELRILAHFSKDQKLIEAFSRDKDIHTFTAGLLFGLDEKDVQKPQRDMAKVVNFGIVYGMSPMGLAKELKIGFKEADVFISDYFARYPGVKNYIDSVYQQVEADGFVRTILGRKRYLPDIKSHQAQLKEFARRQAVNTPIQGSSADIIKAAMVNISREFKEKKIQSRLIMQIHDELVFDCPEQELDKVKEIVRRQMENSIKLDVPLKVDIACGKNWSDMNE
jgi:DNA polymerase-1